MRIVYPGPGIGERLSSPKPYSSSPATPPGPRRLEPPWGVAEGTSEFAPAGRDSARR
ncbi:hypothetical protein BD413DRAFT_562070 [Trametes elegans]|nr:hypothetical protein BD413DRAFT_562070 [Trametes elegans]